MSTRLTDADIRQAAEEHTIEFAALKAVTVVESGGRGFLPDGQCKILFERHILWRRLQTPDRGIDPHALAAANPQWCGPSWNPRRFPYGRVSDQWPRIGNIVAWAQQHDPAHMESYRKSCYESCSWGLFQLLGMNYAAAGFPNIHAFVQAHQQSEKHHLDAILRWMDQNGLLTKLRRKNWEAFARGYNGAGQVPVYAGRLQDAYARFRGR